MLDPFFQRVISNSVQSTVHKKYFNASSAHTHTFDLIQQAVSWETKKKKDDFPNMKWKNYRIELKRVFYFPTNIASVNLVISCNKVFISLIQR